MHLKIDSSNSILDKQQKIKPEKKFFLLHPHCFVVNGKWGSTIYDVYNVELYSVDKIIGEILIDSEKNSKSLDYILKAYDADVKEEILGYLKEMEARNLGTFYDKFVVREKLRPYFSKQFIEEDRKLPFLNRVFLEIESQCNLDCRFCMGKDGEIARCFCSTVRNRGKRSNSIPISKWREVIDDALILSTRQIIFVGGEPLLAKESLFYLIDYIRKSELSENPLNIVVRTNCCLLDKETCEFFKNNNVNLETNICSHKEDVQDWITRTAGSLKRKMENFALAMDYKLRLLVKIEILKQNQNHIQEIVHFLYSLGLKEIYYDYVLTKDNQFYPNEAIKNYYKSENNLKGVTREKFIRSLEGHPCWDGQLAITVNGNILPCIVARNEIIGNMMNQRIIDVLREEKTEKYWYLTKDHIEGCKNCEYRYACFDCRPRESINGSLTARNKYCLIQERR